MLRRGVGAAVGRLGYGKPVRDAGEAVRRILPYGLDGVAAVGREVALDDGHEVAAADLVDADGRHRIDRADRQHMGDRRHRIGEARLRDRDGIVPPLLVEKQPAPLAPDLVGDTRLGDVDGVGDAGLTEINGVGCGVGRMSDGGGQSSTRNHFQERMNPQELSCLLWIAERSFPERSRYPKN